VHLAGGHDIDVVDVLARPEVASADGVIATPAVRRLLPPSTRRIVGDLTDGRLAAIALELGTGRADVDAPGAADARSGGSVTDIRDRLRPDSPNLEGPPGLDRVCLIDLPATAWLAGGDFPQEIVTAVAGGIVVVDDWGTVLLCNRAAEETFGRAPDDLVGLELGVPLSSDTHVVDVLTPDGGTRAVEMRAAQTTWGSMQAHVVAVRDVSHEQRHRAGDEGLRGVFEQSPVGLAVLDSDLRFRHANEALGRLLDRAPAELVGLAMAAVTLPDDRAEESALAVELLAGDIGSYELEKRYVTPAGNVVWGRITASRLDDPSDPASRVIAVIEDVGERREAQVRLADLALHDRLTGLANHALAMDRLQLAQARARRTGSFAAVLVLDLDRFERINDSLGHDAGNAFLVACANRLEGMLRPTDTAARLDGDEFLLCCEDLGTDEGIARRAALDVAKRLASSLARPVTLSNGLAQTRASIGIALTGGNELSAEALLRHAGSAMRRAKEEDGGIEVFDEKHRAHVAGRMEVTEALRLALGRGELVVHYQPIVSIDCQRIIGAEAMVRWNHPTRGLLLPADFIDVAEESSLIIQLGDAVLREACTHLAHWRRTIRPDLVVMVNASARQLGCNVLGASVAGALAASGLEPDALHIELTEGTLIEASGSTLTELRALRSLGVHLGLDDFGTGYASLTYLQRLPVDFVKIDGSFVAGVEGSMEDRAIIEAVIGLGSALGLRVIAEGIEAEGQRKALEDMGCELGQGWHFGRAQPARELTRLL
jgi:diguanylate cyclase (GGDEF)-like protein/PAS domain S-box-containing protein